MRRSRRIPCSLGAIGEAYTRNKPLTARARRPRLDAVLVARGLAESRTRAQALIRAGLVFSGAVRLTRPGRTVDSDAPLEVRGRDHPWASRGGLKLAFALDRFGIDPAGRVALDVGAATGGFTDVLLARGARLVYAVDVGHGQLAPRLSADPRVRPLERTDARRLDPALVPEPPDLIVCDASFIALAKVLPAALALAAPGARLVALVKPQFEVGRDQIKKGGRVRDPALEVAAAERVRAWLAAQPGWRVLGLAECPVRGGAGQREFVLAGRRA